MAQNPYGGPALPAPAPGELTGGVTQSPLAPKPRMTLEQSDMMRNANKNPYSPNNGNPRGSNNMPRSNNFNAPRGRGAGGRMGMTPVMNPANFRREQVPEGPYAEPPLPRVNPASYRNNPQDAPVYPGQGFRSYERDNRIYAGGSPGSSQGIQDMRARLEELYNRSGFGSRMFANGGEGYQQGPSSGYMGGQVPYSGRYRPPMMNGQGNWMDYGGYNYNLPNAFGSYPGYGQGNPNSPYFDEGYSGMYGYGGGG